jgi:hypothetical protein
MFEGRSVASAGVGDDDGNDVSSGSDTWSVLLAFLLLVGMLVVRTFVPALMDSALAAAAGVIIGPVVLEFWSHVDYLAPSVLTARPRVGFVPR